LSYIKGFQQLIEIAVPGNKNIQQEQSSQINISGQVVIHKPS